MLPWLCLRHNYLRSRPVEGVYKWVRVQTQVTKLTKLTKPIDETRVSSMLLRIVRRETPCASPAQDLCRAIAISSVKDLSGHDASHEEALPP